MMRVLLDTHTFIWAVTNDPALTQKGRDIIVDAQAVYVSAASIWEIAIKARLGKINADPALMWGAIDKSGFQELPIRAAHTVGVSQLPLHHNDPFDRLLVAQAISEQFVLLTLDALLPPYGKCILRF